MSDASVRLGLPWMQPGQAQKELTHNEALAVLDLAVQASVVAVGVDAPPAAPAAGEAWVVGSAPTGDWATHAHAIAGWTESGWRFVAAREGLTVWSLADARDARFTAGTWRVGLVSASRVTIDGIPVVGPRGAAISDPSGGAVVDSQARTAIAAILAALRVHGLVAP